MGTNMQDIQFLSTLSLRRATIPFVQFLLHTPISIHALLAESDGGLSHEILPHRHFYPRSPCGERRCADSRQDVEIGFLSTLSLRRATISGVRHKCAIFYFYPRSPCGERRPSFCELPSKAGISIHALLAESDHFDTLSALAPKQFLSTLSLRRATDERV